MLTSFFPSKTFFRMEVIQISSRRFYFALKLPITRIVRKSVESLVSCILHLSGVIVDRKLELVGSNPTVGPSFYFFQTLVNAFIFLNSKK